MLHRAARRLALTVYEGMRQDRFQRSTIGERKKLRTSTRFLSVFMLPARPNSSLTITSLTVIALSVLVFGSSRTAEASCGDYLLYGESHRPLSHNFSPERPAPRPACVGGNCHRAPAESPFESSARISELQLRVRSAIAGDLAADGEREAGRLPLPESDDRPESADVLPLERPPELSRTI